MGGEVTGSQSDYGERILIGIDPGSTTGVCIFGLDSRQIKNLYTLDFWTTYDMLARSAEQLVKTAQIHIEQPSLVKSLYARHAQRLEETKSKIVTRDKIVWDAGANAREGTLLRDGLRKKGYKVFDCYPVGRRKWTSEEFQQIMHWPDRSNQHVRDAAFLIHDKGWLL